jgi:hypothetical protein
VDFYNAKMAMNNLIRIFINQKSTIKMFNKPFCIGIFEIFYNYFVKIFFNQRFYRCEKLHRRKMFFIQNFQLIFFHKFFFQNRSGSVK